MKAASAVVLAAGEGGGGAEEDVKGPHAALAVKLTQRDPDRRFVLGERLQYVLLAGGCCMAPDRRPWRACVGLPVSSGLLREHQCGVLLRDGRGA
jgi:hypothetical protein